MHSLKNFKITTYKYHGRHHATNNNTTKMDSLKNAVGSAMGKDAQPGDKTEGRADNAVNTGIDDASKKVDVPTQDNGVLKEAADDKVNKDIPGGNN